MTTNEKLTWKDTRMILYMSGAMGTFFAIFAWASYGWYYAWRFGLLGFLFFFIFLFGVGITGEM